MGRTGVIWNVSPSLRTNLPALERHFGGDNLRAVAGSIAGELQPLAVIQAIVGKLELILADFLERVVVEPLDQGPEPAVILEDVEDVVVPAVLADETLPLVGTFGGRSIGDAGERCVTDRKRVDRIRFTSVPKPMASSIRIVPSSAAARRS